MNERKTETEIGEKHEIKTEKEKKKSPNNKDRKQSSS